MEIKQKHSRRILLWIGVWFVFVWVSLSAYSFYEVEITKKRFLSEKGETGTLSFSDMEGVLRSNQKRFSAVLAGSLGLSGMLLWLTLQRSIRKIEESGMDTRKPREEMKTPDEEGREDRRRSLQLLTILQREGRLIDFLKEDLEPFDDQQIGAAVRSIHESCRKALETCLDPRAVMDQEEGSEVVVSEGFDPHAVKLTGDVSGNPPFKGILQHRGWRIGRFDLPTLSGSMNPDIISPAEVEI